eukprot:GSMAST32.ASY1.ANO1.66.1 assembled CDS
MFEKSLHDLVKGIRSHKRDVSGYIDKCLSEIKVELRTTNPKLKVQAIQKLVYLQVMAQPLFKHKRMGYLAAEQCFTPQTDLHASNQYEIGLAISCLSNIVTKDLARDLLGDIVAMLSSTRPYIRKKAVLVLYKLYLAYPQALRLSFENLKQKLEDVDPSVVSSAVNVICELSRKNPKNYLSLAPQFFKLLLTSTNNWMLIKVVKLLGELVSEEPRLARKILQPLARLIRATPAKSLMYKILYLTNFERKIFLRQDGKQAKNVAEIASLCMEKLKDFIEDPDQNLKYLGLIGLANLMRSHPKLVSKHKSLVLECLDDGDVTIRLRALELVTGIVTKRSLQNIVDKLMQHLSCAEGQYHFAWYITILIDLAYTKGMKQGDLIAEQLIDVCFIFLKI